MNIKQILQNFNWTFSVGNVSYFCSKSEDLCITLSEYHTSLQLSRIGLTHCSYNFKKISTFKYSEATAFLMQNEAFDAFDNKFI